LDNQKIPIEFKDKFQLIFVTEFWSDDSLYGLWTEGRIEISKWDDEHGNDEIRYCTKKTTEWFEFQEKYNGEWLIANELEEFKKIVQKKFRQKPDKNNPHS
jgi:hypothetical protein